MKFLEILDFEKETQSFEKPVILAILTFFFLLINMGSVLGQDKVKFVAAGVTCSMCSNAIHKSLSEDKTIKEVNPNLQTQVWNLEYKTGEFNLELLNKRVENAGFSIQKVWLNEKLIYEKKRGRNANQKK